MASLVPPKAAVPPQAGPREEAKAEGRRSFLKLMGLGAVAAGGSAAVPTEAEAMRARPDQRAPRYRETDHVKKFYETNRR